MTSETGRTLVIIPTFNEVENLPRILPRVLEQGPAIDVLIVDDASPDGTGVLADEMAQRYPGRIRTLHREGKGGLGPAYLAGFSWGLEQGYDRLCEMDADLSHPPEKLGDMIDAILLYNNDFVIGSRYVDGKVTVVNWPIGRLLISLLGNFYARAVTGLPASDATGGYNLFRREVLASIGLDRVRTNGYAFQVELKFRAWKAGYRFAEIPIVFTERDKGESKMSRRIVAEAVWRVWQIRALHLLGRL